MITECDANTNKTCTYYIEIYSRGKEQITYNGTDYSYIKINGIDYSTSDNPRGFNIIVLNELNGDLIDFVTFDLYKDSDTDDDIDCFNYLRSIHPNRIVFISVYDTASNSRKTMKLLASWGCSYVTYLNYHESFVFIGTASDKNIPSWTWCDTSDDSYILKRLNLSFPIMINNENVSNIGMFYV